MTCGCYEDVTFGNKVCGIKSGEFIIPASSHCCTDDCSGEPYGYGKIYNIHAFIRVAFMMFIIGILMLMYLKIFSVPKV